MFKVRCKGNDDGTYTLSYGKGSKKLTALLIREGKDWAISKVGVYDKKRLAIERWGERAAAAYGAKAPDETPASAAPSPVVSDDGLTWAQAFAFLANAGRPRTPTQRQDLILLLQSLLKEDQPVRVAKNSPTPKLPPPPPYKPKVQNEPAAANSEDHGQPEIQDGVLGSAGEDDLSDAPGDDGGEAEEPVGESSGDEGDA